MAIINKSSHPVEIKRIGVHIWSLRDEIETALILRKQECLELGIDYYYDDIKEFYSRPSRFKYYLKAEENPSEVDDDNEESAGLAGVVELDSSGMPLDEDARAMMEAMQATDEPSEESEETKEAAEDAITDETKENEATANEEKQNAENTQIEASTTEKTNAPSEASVSQETKPIQKIKPFTRPYPASDKMVKGFSLLSDINMKFILIFSKHQFMPGQAVVIEFQIPNKIILSAEMFASTNLGINSRVISEKRPNYRMQCVLTYNQPGERDKLRQFLSSIVPDIPPPVKKIAKTKDADDDLDFDDLGL